MKLTKSKSIKSSRRAVLICCAAVTNILRPQPRSHWRVNSPSLSVFLLRRSCGSPDLVVIQICILVWPLPYYPHSNPNHASTNSAFLRKATFFFMRKKIARYPPSLSRNPLLCFYHTLSAVAAVEAAVAANSRSTTAAAAGAIYSSSSTYASSERHISRGGEQGAGRDVSCAEMGPVISLGMPCRPGT